MFEPYTVDIKHLESKLDHIPNDPRQVYEGTVVSPLDLLQRERFIDGCKSKDHLGGGINVDLVVFGYDEPADRGVTKIGGLPYWPKQKKWPISSNGIPLEFLAQLNFAGSLDIIPPVPEAMLSIFIRASWCEIEEFHYFWQNPSKDVDLVSEADIPVVENKQVASPAYGIHHRTKDFPKARFDKSRLQHGEKLMVVRGTKIGGVPRFFYKEANLPGRYLFTLHSMRHPANYPWPFINVPDPLTPEMLGGVGTEGGRGCHDTIMFGSQGSIFFYIDHDGIIREELQCW